MGISLSDKAAKRVREFMQHEGGVGMRFGVRRTGCSGWAYDVGIAREVKDGDHHFTDQGIDIYVDDQSLSMVDGTRIDFVRQGLNHHFVFENPNVAAECGCGESFTTASSGPDNNPVNPF